MQMVWNKLSERMDTPVIKPITDWLSEDGETSKYACTLCDTRKSVKYAIFSPDPNDHTFLPLCNRCASKFNDDGEFITRIKNRNDIVRINDEIWKLKEECLDLADPSVGQILYRLCQMVQEITVALSKGE